MSNTPKTHRMQASTKMLLSSVLAAVPMTLGVVGSAKASIDLGAAGQFTVFSLSGTQDNFGSGKVTGTFGIGSKGNLNIGGTSSITDGLTLNEDGTSSNNATYTRSGTASTGVVSYENLDAAVTSATSDSTTFSALTPTQAFGNINLGGSSTQTITATPGENVNVIDVSSITLGASAVLTLSGSASTEFIINDPGVFNMGGSSQLLLTGGLTENNVVFNLTESGGGASTVQLAGEHAYGIYLAPKADVLVDPGIVYGQVIAGGGTLSINSGAQVIAPPITSVPTPATLSLLGTGLLGLGLIALRKRRLAPLSR